MRVSSIPLTALLGLPALGAAFLLPPPPDIELPPIFKLNEAEAAILSEDPKSAVIKGSHTAITLPCTGCVWHRDVTDEQGVAFTEGLESELLFDITIPASTPSSLLINNKPVVPFAPLHGLSALQVPASASAEDVFTISHPFRPLKLGYDLLVTSMVNLRTPDKKDIVVKLRITAVDGVHNDFIPDLEVLVVEDMNTGTLEIISSHVNPIEELGHRQTLGEEEACQGIDCVIAKLKDRLDRMRDRMRNRHGKDAKKGCHGGRKDTHAPPEFPHDHVPPHRGGPGRHGPHHHGHRQGDHFWSALIGHVLMPILIGIMAGVGVSIIGLVLSQGATKVWRVVKAKKNGGEVEEGRGMLKAYADEEQEDGLPAYVEQGIEVVEKQ